MDRLMTCGRGREDIGDNHEILPGGSGAELNISSLQEGYCGSLRRRGLKPGPEDGSEKS